MNLRTVTECVLKAGVKVANLNDSKIKVFHCRCEKKFNPITPVTTLSISGMKS